MGVDLVKVRQKIKEDRAREANKGKKFSVTLYWKPKVGENRIRIMPPWTTEGPNGNFFYRDVFIHWRIGANAQMFACPQAKVPDSPGIKCPICEYYFSLFKTGNPLDKEKAKDFRAKRQGYLNIVDLKDPVYTEADITDWVSNNTDANTPCPYKLGDTKVQVYTPAGGSISDIENFFQDADMSDLDAGHDFIIDRVGTTKDDTKYKIRINPTATPFKFIGDMAARLYNFDAMMPFVPVAQLEEALNSTAALPATPAAAPKPMLATKSVAALPAAKAAVDDTDDLPEHLGGKGDQSDTGTEPPPECFKDPGTHSADNAQCAGGVLDGEEYDECPYYTECAAACAPPAPVKRRPRGAKAAVVSDAGSSSGVSDIDAIEAEMRSKIR